MSDKPTHTPGPWTFTEGRQERREASTVHRADDKEFAIALVTCEWMNEQQRLEDIANAHLIAAAPELLEALRDLECEASAELEPTTSVNAAILTARAALAKAEGR